MMALNRVESIIRQIEGVVRIMESENYCDIASMNEAAESLKRSLKLLEYVRNELNPVEKRMRKAIVCLVSEPKEGTLKVVVPQWDAKKQVPIPAWLIPSEIIAKLGGKLNEKMLIADVNIDAKKAEDLMFANFEIAPEPE